MAEPGAPITTWTRPVRAPTQRWRLDVAYDGSDFSGWAIQTGRRTVQGELQGWLSRLLPVTDPVRLVGAGRTDAGVHARGQVAHFDVAVGVVTEGGADLFRRLGHVLPDDIVVRRLSAAPAGFDARFAAIWRRYVYRLADDTVAFDPQWRHSVTRLDYGVDLAAMNHAATVLIGLRDFGTFCKRKGGATTTIRTLLELRGERQETGILDFTVRADAFCHSMVRSLMGGLVGVGSGRRDVDWLVQVTRAAVRQAWVPVLAPTGLTLEEVGYPSDDQLAARSRESRARRELP